MGAMIKGQKQGERQDSKTELQTYWRERKFGKLPAEECKLSCSLFTRIYGPWGCACWLLLPCPAPVPHPLSRRSNTQPRGISQRRSFLEPWVTVAPQLSWGRGTLLRRNNFAVPNWALWTVLQHCVCKCVGEKDGWVSAPKPWVSSLPVSQKNNLQTPPCWYKYVIF